MASFCVYALVNRLIYLKGKGACGTYLVVHEHHARRRICAEVVRDYALDADDLGRVDYLLLRLDAGRMHRRNDGVSAYEDLLQSILSNAQEIRLVYSDTAFGELDHICIRRVASDCGYALSEGQKSISMKRECDLRIRYWPRDCRL